MIDVSLTDLANLENQTTAVNAINNNNATITTAFEDALSLSGTLPNQMGSNIDMNSFRILNLPSPLTADEPLRLQDLDTFVGGGTVTNIPAGGNTGDRLVKTSNLDYQVGWGSEAADLAAGTNIVITGSSPATIATTATPTFTTVNKVTLTAPSAGSTLTIADGKTLTASNTLTLAGTDSTVMTFPATSATIARTDASNTFTGHQTIEGVTSTGATGSGKFVFDTTPTLATPILGIATATSINKVTITAPATSAVLTIADGKTLTASRSLTLTGTDSTVMTFPTTSATIARTDTGQTFTGTNAFGVVTATTLNGNTFTTGTYTLTGTAAKTLNFTNSLTLSGTDATTMTFPTTTATIARTDTGQTFTGTNAFGVITATTLNGNTFTTGTYTLTGTAAKTLNFTNTLTLSGTDSTTMTFPTTSATIARTDAANTFTGHQTIEGITSTGATGTGQLVFSIGPTFTGTVGGAALTLTNNSTNALILTGSSSNSIGLLLTNTVASGHSWGVYSSGSGPSPLGSFVFYDTTAGGARMTISGSDGAVSLNSTTAATSTATGSFITSGGIGVAGAGYFGAEIKSTSATAGVGYGTGAGGAVTQATSRTTGVTLNTASGAITLFSQVNTAVSAATAQSFTLTNSAIAATDVVHVTQKSGTDLYEIFVTATAAGSCKITNYSTGGTTNEAPVFNFVVIKGVTS